MTGDAYRPGLGSASAPEPSGLGPSGAIPNAGPIRVQLSRKKGFRLPPNTKSVARPGRHGNPFTVGCNPSHFSAALPDHCDTIEEAVECFRYYAETWIALTRGGWIEPLRGANLACWCKLGTPCHADVLLKLANAGDVK